MLTMVCNTAWNRTTTENSHQPTHQAARVQMGLRDKPQWTTDCQIGEVKQPILSVTKLVEQGFQLTLGDNPRLQHHRIQQHIWRTEMACSSYKQKSQHCQEGRREIHSAQQGQDWHDSTDHNAYTTRSCRHRLCRRLLAVQHTGELVRVHRQYRKTLFTPSRTQCPVPAEQLDDYEHV